METNDSTEQGPRQGWRRVWAVVKRVVGSTWMVPVFCLVVELLSLVVGAWVGTDRPRTTPAGSMVLEFTTAFALLAIPVVLLWFIGTCFMKQSWGQRGLRLLFTLLLGGATFAVLVMYVVMFAFVNDDHRADNWVVPEGVALEVPADFYVDDDAPDIVKRLAGEQSGHGTSTEKTPLPEGSSPLPPKNLELLAKEHPDLLREFWMRAKLLGRQEYTRCHFCDWPQGGTGYHCTIKLAGTGTTPATKSRDEIFDDSPDTTVSTVEQLENGWSLLSLMREVSFGDGEKLDGERIQAFTVQQYDEHFAELAQHPAMETVETLLPLPQTPCLKLAESAQPGIYSITIWLPKDARRDGHYEIRAFEYNTGTELSLERDPTLKPESGYELANAFVLENPDFMVYTGDWGQYYGSRWQVWFVPNQGEKELVCEQLFLMQGWMR